MPPRRSSRTNKKSSKSSSPAAQRSWRVLTVIFLLCAGALLGNLDRLGVISPRLWKYQRYLPTPVRWLLPDISFATAEKNTTIQGTAIDVYDGDTITVFDDNENKQYKIRFFGMDAPEKNQTFGLNSTQMLSKLILNKNVSIKVVNIDNYQRIVGKVYCDNEYINLYMIKNGGAWWYQQYAASETDLKNAQVDARDNRRGLWNSAYALPPWEYRRLEKQK